MVQMRVFSVFSGPDAVGNPTGIVELDDAPKTHWAQHVAASLGFPDTAFTWRKGDRDRIRFFSPNEELTVCYQAMIAAACATGRPEVQFDLEDRRLVVETDRDVGWVLTPGELVRDEGPLATPFGVGTVVDVGRRRVYVPVDSRELEQTRWEPDAALAWLGEHSLSGLCLVHCGSDGTARLRVFTTSLGGREDVATGGAAAGLPMFLRSSGLWVIHQGVGARTRRGELLVRTADGRVYVGGRVTALLAGSLDSSLLAD